MKKCTTLVVRALFTAGAAAQALSEDIVLLSRLLCFGFDLHQLRVCR